MKVLVLGSGVIGVTSAWYLRAQGHEVTVVDRQPAPGLETSYANGAQISASYALPWANPHAPLQVLKWLGREDAPLLFRLRADIAQWRWGLQFLRECLPSRTQRNVEALLHLAFYSRAQLQALRAETHIEYEQRTAGILLFYTDAEKYKDAAKDAKMMAKFGPVRVPKTPAEMLALEPALAHIAPQIVGGDYTPDDESGDAFLFTQRLAELCKARGVTFMQNTNVTRIQRENDKIAGVLVKRDGEESTLNADAYVVALGSYSPLMLRPLGLRLPIYPVKGYSVTIPLTENAVAPTMSLTDEAHKIVFSRLGNRLRVAGTAELNGYDNSINNVRCDALLKRTEALFPSVFSEAGVFEAAERWAGLRPATPSNVPYVGATRYSNLFLNTGHGTLGWTMACGSGRLLADVISARKPEVDPTPYAVS